MKKARIDLRFHQFRCIDTSQKFFPHSTNITMAVVQPRNGGFTNNLETMGKSDEGNICSAIVTVLLTIISVIMVLCTFPFSLCVCIRMVQVSILLTFWREDVKFSIHSSHVYVSLHSQGRAFFFSPTSPTWLSILELPFSSRYNTYN